ncbi:unnamed protein product [Adineta ricciae]|uniref:Peptidase metallopeptidase domain-containing protein n=2 Tax=Adineta ricciae TaxID=249248 RepID=A0A814PU11_ADIRI|nr:unnamed protein product [Adineta ricciae]
MFVVLYIFAFFTLHQVSAAPAQSLNSRICGVGDETLFKLHAGDLKWSKSRLTWSIQSYPWKNEISASRTEEILQEAFQAYASHTSLEFEKVCSTCAADIVIKFVSRAHAECENHPFDGQGGTLAHADPPTNGQVHFDFDEVWTENNEESKINLFLVALHEIGHALGLDHSRNTASIMQKTYPFAGVTKSLSSVDIESIQHLYGAKKQVDTNSAEYIKTTFQEAFPNDAILVYRSTTGGWGRFIGKKLLGVQLKDDYWLEIFKVSQSTGETMTSDAIKSIANDVITETKSETDNVKRRDVLHEKLKALFPNHNVHVFLFNDSHWSRSTHSHKGAAYYEKDYGSEVDIVLS